MFKTYIPPTNGNIEELQKLAEKMESYWLSTEQATFITGTNCSYTTKIFMDNVLKN
jgi:hypothetical protein